MTAQKTAAEYFEEFNDVVRRLRKECPWDREQTHQSMRHNLLEEAYEVIESIDHNDLSGLKQELGDLILHVALHSVIAEEEQAFSIESVLQAATEKLIRRHPHVFGDAETSGAQEVRANWERIKMTEGRTSALDGVPKQLPALLRASRVQEKASHVGFDWPHKRDVWAKVEEELSELQTAPPEDLEEELGDVLFSLVNYSRFLNVNPELALAGATEKFMRRFYRLEKQLSSEGKKPEAVSLKEMDELWDRGKREEG